MEWIYSAPVKPPAPPAPPAPPEFIGITTAASRRGCSEITIRRAILEGKLTAHKEGNRVLVRTAELDALPKPPAREDVTTYTRGKSGLLSEN